jgi:hypothetical protein
LRDSRRSRLEEGTHCTASRKAVRIGSRVRVSKGTTFHASVTIGFTTILPNGLHASEDGDVVSVRSIWSNNNGEGININGDRISGFTISNGGLLVSPPWSRGVQEYLRDQRTEIFSHTLIIFKEKYHVKVMALLSRDQIYLMPVGGAVPMSWYK